MVFLPFHCQTFTAWETLYTSSKTAALFILSELEEAQFISYWWAHLKFLAWRGMGEEKLVSAHLGHIREQLSSVQLLVLIRYFLNICMLARGKDGRLQGVDWKHFLWPLSACENWSSLFLLLLITYHWKPLVESLYHSIVSINSTYQIERQRLTSISLSNKL